MPMTTRSTLGLTIMVSSIAGDSVGVTAAVESVGAAAASSSSDPQAATRAKSATAMRTQIRVLDRAL